VIPATFRRHDAPGPDPAEVLSLVRSSPEAVAAHDKERWLALFADPHVVEDPVGSRPVRSEDPGALCRFWEAFIAPNDIVFHVDHDWVAGGQVVRDVTIETTMSTGVSVRTPAHLLYEVVEEAGELRIARMAAHWEPAPVFGQLMRPRLSNVRSLAGMSVSMLTNLGPYGTLRFAGAVRSVGRRGKETMREALGDQATYLTKVIASGHVVTANAVVAGEPAAVIATLEPDGRRVRDLDVYTGLV
jgi:hypothetical protein